MTKTNYYIKKLYINRLYHFYSLKTNTKAIFLGLILLFSSEFVLFSEEFIEVPKEINGKNIVFKAKEKAVLDNIVKPEALDKFQEIFDSLNAFEKKFHQIKILNKCEFEIVFQDITKTDCFSSEFIVNALYSGNDSLKPVNKNFSIIKTYFNNEGDLVYMRFRQNGDDEAVATVVDLYNIQRDKQGDIRKRMFLKFKEDLKVEGHPGFFKFIDGIWIEYGPYLKFNEPVSITCKTFILDEKGWKIWTHVTKRSNRGFNEKGQLVRETTQETSYNYSRPVSSRPYDVYDLSFYPGGEINSYNLVFRDALKEPSNTEPKHLEFNFKWSSEGVLLEKMMRKYRIVDNTKEYIRGESREYTLDGPAKAVKLKETTFNIRSRTDGFLKKDRILKKTILTWNLSFDEKNKVLSRKVLEFKNIPSNKKDRTETINVFQSLKEVRFVDDAGGRLKGVLVDYYDFTEDGKCSIVRSVGIDVIAHNRSGDPAKIVLAVISPHDISENSEMILTQDCNYVIGEAVLGDMFLERQEKTFSVYLERIPEPKESLKGTVVYIKREDEKENETKEGKLNKEKPSTL
jgi:hypothetical protein